MTLRHRAFLCGGRWQSLILADYQAITDRTSTDAIKTSVREIILDYLATGIDPKKSTIFCHSMVPSLN